MIPNQNSLQTLINAIIIAQQRGKFAFEESAKISSVLNFLNKDKNEPYLDKDPTKIEENINILVNFANVCQCRGTYTLDESFLIASAIHSMYKANNVKKNKLDTIPEEIV